MVTKKKIVSPELRLKQLTVYPERILYAYRRNAVIGVITRMRYDPHYSTATQNDPMCAKYTQGFYFLSQLHYEQLMFAQRFLEWAIDLTYDSFMKLFTDFFESSNLDVDSTYIVTLKVFGDGHVVLEAEETEPIKNLFVGLLDHLRLTNGIPVASDGDSETYLVESEAIPVYFDTDFTLPSKYTLFESTDRTVYDEPPIRVKNDYKLDNELEEFEVLLWSSVQYVMSTLDSVVAVFKDDAWYVPHPSAGGRMDPLRMVLVEQGIVQEAQFNVQRLEPGDDVLLISAQFGVRRGVLMGRLPEPLSRYSRNRKPKPNVLQKRTHVQIGNSEAAARHTSETLRGGLQGEFGGIPGTSILKFKKPEAPT